VFVNIVLKTMLGLRKEVKQSCQNLFHEKCYDPYTSPKSIMVKQIREDDMGSACGIYGGGGRGREEQPVGSPRRRWENNIKTELKGNIMEWCRLDSLGSGQAKVMVSCKGSNKKRVP
jgi:hypothetical protein